MSLTLTPDNLSSTWQGIISLQYSDDWVMPWRIPYNDRGLFLPIDIQDRAALSAGVRISFYSDTTEMIGEVISSKDPGSIDLFCDGKFYKSLEMEGKNNFVFQNLPSGEKLIELWLPQYTEFRLKVLHLDDSSSFTPYSDQRPKWTTYGSSITHCAGAEKPSNTWPGIVSRNHGLNLTCLGYGGNCHLEPMIARMIRDLPADFISIKVGINIQNSSSLSIRTFAPAIVGFVKIIREKHPNTPLVVISPIYSSPREQQPNLVGSSLEDFRVEVANTVSVLQSHGDSNIHCVDGLNLFDAKTIEDAIRPIAAQQGVKTGQLFGTIRIAVTGRTAAPPLFDTLAILGKRRCLNRIDKALGILAAHAQ